MSACSNPKYVRRLPDGRYEYGRIDLSVADEHVRRYVMRGTADTLEKAVAKNDMAPLKETT